VWPATRVRVGHDVSTICRFILSYRPGRSRRDHRNQQPSQLAQATPQVCGLLSPFTHFLIPFPRFGERSGRATQCDRTPPFLLRPFPGNTFEGSGYHLPSCKW
jgi:hypothetical protein